jgi:hypothetical protein
MRHGGTRADTRRVSVCKRLRWGRVRRLHEIGVSMVRLIGWLLVLLAVVRILCYGAYASFALWVPGDITYPEGALVYGVQRVAEGRPLYQDFRRLPHLTIPYGPGFFYLVGELAARLGAGLNGSYVLGRIVAQSAFFLSVLLCAIWARGMGGGWRAAAATAAVAWASPYFGGVTVSGRVDTLATAAALFGLWVAFYWQAPARWVLVWLLMLAAWTCKQTDLAAAIAVSTTLLHAGRWKAAVGWTLAWLAGIAGLWFWFDRQTEGLFTLNAITALPRPVDLQGGMRMLGEAVVHLGTVLVAAAWLWRRAGREPVTRPAAWWFLLAGIQGVLLLGGEGAGGNYLLETWLAGCMLASQWLAPASPLPTSGLAAEPGGTSMHRPWLRPMFATILAAVLAYDCWTYTRHFAFLARVSVRTTPESWQAGRMPHLLPLVARCRGPVFIQYPYLALRSGRAPIVLDVLHYRQLADRGVISPDLLADQFQRRYFLMVVLRGSLAATETPSDLMRWPEQVRQAVYNNYEFVGVIDENFVYTPKGLVR